MLRITILYDNKAFKEGLKSDWGFSCLIEKDEQTLLFDTGAKGDILIDNMKSLGIQISDIHKIFISHEHWDHIGGLLNLLELNNEITVYLLKSFSKNFRETINRKVKRAIEITKPRKLFDDFYTTGEMGDVIKEQSLFIKSKKGLIIIVGCSHPGIINIIKKVKRIAGEIYMVLGGFHLFGLKKEEIEKIISRFKKLEITKIAPAHCSGAELQLMLAQNYKEIYEETGVGKIIEV